MLNPTPKSRALTLMLSSSTHPGQRCCQAKKTYLQSSRSYQPIHGLPMPRRDHVERTQSRRCPCSRIWTKESFPKETQEGQNDGRSIWRIRINLFKTHAP